jgi:hypothetical protein
VKRKSLQDSLVFLRVFESKWYCFDSANHKAPKTQRNTKSTSYFLAAAYASKASFALTGSWLLW